MSVVSLSIFGGQNGKGSQNEVRSFTNDRSASLNEDKCSLVLGVLPVNQGAQHLLHPPWQGRQSAGHLFQSLVLTRVYEAEDTESD